MKDKELLIEKNIGRKSIVDKMIIVFIRVCVSNALRIKWQMRNRSGLHRITLPGISFINIRCQSRLEGNNR